MASSRQLKQAHIDKLGEIAVVYNPENAILRGGTSTLPNTGSKSSIDSALYCKFCIQKKHMKMACNMILDSLR